MAVGRACTICRTVDREWLNEQQDAKREGDENREEISSPESNREGRRNFLACLFHLSVFVCSVLLCLCSSSLALFCLTVATRDCSSAVRKSTSNTFDTPPFTPLACSTTFTISFCIAAGISLGKRPYTTRRPPLKSGGMKKGVCSTSDCREPQSTRRSVRAGRRARFS